MIGRFFETYINVVRKVLPSPFSIALILSVLTLLSVAAYGALSGRLSSDIVIGWANGLWEPNLMVFAMQMMLVLVLGHSLALSPVVSKIIDWIVIPCTNTSKSAALISFFTMIIALFNWGLGLIFGAILARRVGEKASQENRSINYALIGAAGYSGMLIWHGGISGSSLIKVAEQGHLESLMGASFEGHLPSAVSLGDTVFSSLNLWITAAVLIVIPTSLFFAGKFKLDKKQNLNSEVISKPALHETVGLEKLDYSSLFSKTIGLALLVYCLYVMLGENGFLQFFNPNNINLLLLALCLFSHDNINSFTESVDNAIKGASGILIQFPLYFGILALMKQSGIIETFSQYLINHSSQSTFPLFTFISAGIVNIFVPSGGGQWAIQGPIIIQSSMELNIPLSKGILALAYGDEVTNMLQPFWALPLLGITKLTGRDILPYTLVMFLMAFLIFAIGLSIM